MATTHCHSPCFAPPIRGTGTRTPQTRATDDSLAAESPSLPRILIVEDDYLVASELEAALEDAGFAVIGVARSAHEAVSLAKSERPQVAVVDVRLVGDHDGIDAALAMFKDLGIRSIFATAHSDEPTRQRAKAANPLGWVPKPYTPAQVVPLIRSYLAAKKD
jgi:DNA-binding NarL/FixJ family response regulator